jgi:hypothetical protein
MIRITHVLAVVVVPVALSAFVAGGAVAKPSPGGSPGNSKNAQACNKGKWASLYRSDGSGFRSQDECVSYAAKGGTLTSTPPYAPYQTACQGAGNGENTSFSIGTGDTWICEYDSGSVDGATLEQSLYTICVNAGRSPSTPVNGQNVDVYCAPA